MQGARAFLNMSAGYVSASTQQPTIDWSTTQLNLSLASHDHSPRQVRHAFLQVLAAPRLRRFKCCGVWLQACMLACIVFICHILRFRGACNCIKRETRWWCALSMSYEHLLQRVRDFCLFCTACLQYVTKSSSYLAELRQLRR